MRFLAAAVYAPWLLAFTLWALLTQSLTRGPAGAIGALILLLPAACGAWGIYAVLAGRIKAWGRLTRAVLAFEVLALCVFAAFLPAARRSYQRRREVRTLEDLAFLRTAISRWNKDRGAPPERPSELVPHYLPILPRLSLPGTAHPVTREAEFVQATGGIDTGKWLYVNNPGNPFYGRVRINCTHTDSRGISWSSF